jgi:alanine racemase
MKGERPTVAAIHLSALASNFAEAQRLAGSAAVIAVVKADGYGHGAVPVARRLVAAGCAHFAVATVAEAAELRAGGIDVPILVLGGVHDAAEADDVIEAGVTPVVQHAGHVPLLRKRAHERGTALPVQVEVDTGMCRMGVSPEEAPTLIESLLRGEGLTLEGVYTHLACADDADLGSVRAQLALFGEVLAALETRGIDPGLVHVANSAALLATEDLTSDLPPGINAVRPGLMLYGVCPARHLEGRAQLRPAMSLRTRIANVRHVRPGEPVGYGATFRAKQRGRIATLPIGYADGVPWSLGNRGQVLVRGRRTPVAGRISMDLTTLDLGESDVKLGEPVVVFGASNESREAVLPVEQVAEAAGTIPYELLVRVGQRVPRVLDE